MLDSVQMATDERVGTVRVASMHSGFRTDASGWSNRILYLAIAAILVLTLYPFRFDFTRHLGRPLFPFSLGGWGKGLGPLDDFLNVLLFVPFGFGLAEKLRERGKSRLATLGFTLAAGAALSYTIELLQIFIPLRDSGWEDIITNSFGAVAGALLFDLCGRAVVRLFSATEGRMAAWLTWQRALLALLIYMGLWSAVTVRLRGETRLSSWSLDSVLVIGNSALDHFSSAWKGQVLALEAWDRPVSPEFARRITAMEPTDSPAPDSVIAYRFSGPGPFIDERHLLSGLSRMPPELASAGSSGAFLDGKSWLISPSAIAPLIHDWRETGQFSLWVVCEPAEVDGVDAGIVSVSSPSGTVNMELRQVNASLVFWFRTPLSAKRGRMSWIVRKVFAAAEKRNILFTFDTANLHLFIDGQEHDHAYELGPGVALARFVRRIKVSELKGYKYVFYTLVFIPAGCLFGFIWRIMNRRSISLSFLLLLGLALPAVLFEVVLAYESGRALSFENIWLSLLLVGFGSIWINADRSSQGAPRGQGELSSASGLTT